MGTFCSLDRRTYLCKYNNISHVIHIYLSKKNVINIYNHNIFPFLSKKIILSREKHLIILIFFHKIFSPYYWCALICVLDCPKGYVWRFYIEHKGSKNIFGSTNPYRAYAHQRSKHIYYCSWAISQRSSWTAMLRLNQ